MHTIYRKQNYRNIWLEDHTEGETVGVMARDGRARQIRCSALSGENTPGVRRGRPVKLVISRVGRTDLQPGQYVQGCLVEDGVYAVIDSAVAVVDCMLWLRDRNCIPQWGETASILKDRKISKSLILLFL